MLTVMVCMAAMQIYLSTADYVLSSQRCASAKQQTADCCF